MTKDSYGKFYFDGIEVISSGKVALFSYKSHLFSLDKGALEIRIMNKKKQHRNTVMEERALRAIEEYDRT